MSCETLLANGNKPAKSASTRSLVSDLDSSSLAGYVDVGNYVGQRSILVQLIPDTVIGGHTVQKLFFDPVWCYRVAGS